VVAEGCRSFVVARDWYRCSTTSPPQ
jgi:hypothetical protein